MERRLVIPKTARSDVWQYFGFEADELGNIVDKRCVWCRLCNSQILFSGNTTNLSTHIVKCRMRFADVYKPNEQPIIEARSPTKKVLESTQWVDITEQVTSNEDNILPSVENDQFSLKWKYHQQNQQLMFSQLLEKEMFCDITLACEDKLINAHKLVLASCSPYFEMILQKHYEKHPIIVLKDVKHNDMSILLQFIYNGEVNVEQDQLQSVLEAAEALKIRGLCQSEPSSPEPSTSQEDILEGMVDTKTLYPVQVLKRKRKNSDQLTGVVKQSCSSSSVDTITGSLTPTKIVYDTLQPQYSPKNKLKKYQQGVIPLPEYIKLNGGRTGKFWREPWVIRIMEGIKDNNLKLEEGAKILNISNQSLFQHFRSRSEKLKTKVVWTHPELIAKNKTQENKGQPEEKISDVVAKSERKRSEVSEEQDDNAIYEVGSYSCAADLIDDSELLAITGDGHISNDHENLTNTDC